MRSVPVLAVVAIVASVARASWTGRSRFVLAANVPKYVEHHSGNAAAVLCCHGSIAIAKLLPFLIPHSLNFNTSRCARHARRVDEI
jgi:hypothetical protein